MFEIEKHESGIVEISFEGHFSADSWAEYQRLMTQLLDEAGGKLCILSNFAKTETFDSHLVKEVGTAKHLGHANLGFLILLGGNPLHNFVFSLTESRAMRENKDIKMRIERDRKRALDTLQHFQNLYKAESSS